MLEEKERKQKQMREDYAKKIEGYKQTIGKATQELEKRLNQEIERVNKLKGEVAMKGLLERENSKRGVQIEGLEMQIKEYEEAVKAKEKKYEITMQTVQSFMKQVESLSLQQAKVEKERNQMKSHYLDMKNDVLNVINVVNLIATKKKEKAQIQMMIQKLSSTAANELKPFFTENKIKI